MTVKQLIEKLSQIEDQDVRVMVSGYEGGLDDITSDIPVVVNVALNVNTQWYYGKHEVQHSIHEYESKQIVQAIIL